MVDAEGKKLLGAVLVGDTSDYSLWHQTVANAMALPENPETMLFPAAAATAGAPPTNALAALPETAQICSCNNVSKGGLCAAIEGGLHDGRRAEDQDQGGHHLRRLHAAGDADPQRRAQEARRERQHLDVRALPVHAPAAVPPGAHRRAQDLRGRDRASTAAAWAATSASRRWRPSWRPAGTSSCSRSATRRCRTPTTTSSPTCRRTAPIRWCRACPAARSRPRSSSPSAQVAKKYGLYTKITGGQRIDLFGAQVHQLPLIWRELIDAGFESGHAYGKALRTVKSCVGSTWCRYGVQDSRRSRHRPRESLQGPARASQDQVRRVRLHARMRRGAEQGRRRHRHREAAGTSTSAATAA